MRLLSHAAAPALLALALVPAPAAAQSDSSAASGFSIYAETRLVTRYIWRGYDDARKAASLQPYVELGLPYGITTYAWATGGLDSHRDVDEINLSVRYAQTFGDWEVGLGYLHYILPGTLTEPGPDPVDPLLRSTTGEVFLSLTRSWETGSAALTYSRGNRAMKGNSLELRIEGDYSWGDEAWTAQPYLQLNYLDEYGATRGFDNRFSMIEVGVPVLRRLGPVQFLAGAHVSFVPSAYVRASNAAAGATSGVAIPWFTIGVVYEP
jgi:hypothetical protein